MAFEPQGKTRLCCGGLAGSLALDQTKREEDEVTDENGAQVREFMRASYPEIPIINGNSLVSNLALHDSILRDLVYLVGSTRRMNIGDHSLIDMHG